MVKKIFDAIGKVVSVDLSVCFLGLHIFTIRLGGNHSPKIEKNE